MKLKICGINDIDNLVYCIDRQVDYIGINFCQNSKRYYKNGNIMQNLSKIDKKNTKLVAIVQNIAEDVIFQHKFDVMQLCGDTDIDFGAEKWKTVSIDNYDKYLHYDKILFDNSHGSGKVFDADIPSNISLPYGVAGGINASNIAILQTCFMEEMNRDFWNSWK